MRASNAIYDIEEGRPIWKTLPLRVGLTVALLVLVAISAAGVVITGGIAKELGDVIGVGDTAVTVWNIAKWPVLLLIVSFMFALLYWAAPNVKQPGFRWLSPGGILAVIGWIIASVAFAFYVGELRLLQQDLRRARRADRVPALALDLEHRASCSAPSSTPNSSGAGRSKSGMRPEDTEPFVEPRDAPKEKQTAD